MLAKYFKHKYELHDLDESKFIIGIDMGNSTSSLSYFDVSRQEPELIDISGGYGKASVPTVIQYIEETKEWVFGEYAIMNKGFAGDMTFDKLVHNLGKMMYYEVSGKAVNLSYILSLYIKELVSNIKNLNPNSEIIGIVVAVPSYMSEEAKSEMLLAFKLAELDKKIIDFVTDRHCIFSHYFYKEPVKNEKVLLLDFGGRGIRGGIYKITDEEAQVTVNSVSSLFDETIGTEIVESEVNRLFKEYYIEKTNNQMITPPIKSQIESFAYQHKDFLFQKQYEKAMKLYFNFAYPPFQKSVGKEEIETLILPFRKKMERFLINIFSKTSSPNEKILPSDINTIICTGGGFEMLWVRTLVQNAFPLSKIKVYKNSKAAVSMGASIVCAERLSVISKKPLHIIDKHQLTSDIGIKVRDGAKEKFIAIIERNSFWWQNHPSKSFILNEKTDVPVTLEIFRRDEEGDLFLLDEIRLDGLPLRPKGTTKVSLSLEFESYDQLKLTVKDMGFGEIFPKSDFCAVSGLDFTI